MSLCTNCSMRDEAEHFAQEFISLEYFSHSLEVLIHNILELEVDTGELALLPTVVSFIDTSFPQFFLEIVVRCARKTEVSFWEFFFGVVGDTKDLFRRCLEDGALQTATSYLIIIQTLEPIAVSGKLATELLDKALYMEKFEVCSSVK
jgi:hypothetical protein